MPARERITVDTGHNRIAAGLLAAGLVAGLLLTHSDAEWPGAHLLAVVLPLLWLSAVLLAAGLRWARPLLAGLPPLARGAAAATLAWGALALLVTLVLLAGGTMALDLLLALLAVGGTLLLALTDAWYAWLRDLPALWRAAAPDAASRWARLGLLLALFPALLCVSAPPVAYDAMTYHLALPQAYLNAGGIVPLTHNHYSGFPKLVEMLFLLALAAGNPALAHGICFLLGLWLLALLWALARYRMALPPAAAWLAALLAATIPEVWDALSVAMVDLPAALFAALALWYLTGTTRADAAGAGLATGCMLGCKYTLWPALAFHLLIVLVRLRREAGTFLAAALAACLLWPLLNLALYGNPVYPFGGPLLPTPGIDDDLRVAYARQGFDLFGTRKGLPELLARPWDMVMNEEQFGAGTRGSIGPLLLLLLPFTLGARLRDGRLYLLLGAAWFFWWSYTSQQNRHLLFLLCLLCVPAAGAVRHLARTAWLRPLLTVVLTVACVHGVAWGAMKKEAFYSAWDWAAGALTRDAYLTRHYPGWQVVQQVNRLGADAGTVLFVGHEFGAYLEHPAVVAPAYSRDLLEQLLHGRNMPAPATAAALNAALRAQGIRYVAWSAFGFRFKQGFRHYRCDPPQAALLQEFRRTQLVPLSAPADDLVLYALAEVAP